MESFPFDSRVTYDEQGQLVYDRAISSQPLRKLIRDLFTTGVMPNPSTCFQVSEGTDGMTVKVAPGFAVIDGGLCRETDERTLEFQAADATNDRIDTVVLRWNENVDYRTADLYVLTGIPAETPVRPTLQRDNSIYEIGLADVFITSGVATITNEKITDTRLESERCGIVSSVSQWDTTTLYQQIQSDLLNFKTVTQADYNTWVTQKTTEYGIFVSESQADYNTWISTNEAAFLAWFDEMQAYLDEDVAARLTAAVAALETNIGDLTQLATTDKSNLVSAINELKSTFPGVDTTVTPNSNNLITSGAVWTYVDTMITQALANSY